MSVDIDTSVIEHLDFTEALPCESVSPNAVPNCPGGPNTAVWKVTTTIHCGIPGNRIKLYCHECYSRRVINNVVQCSGCQEIIEYVPTIVLVEKFRQ